MWLFLKCLDKFEWSYLAHFLTGHRSESEPFPANALVAVGRGHPLLIPQPLRFFARLVSFRTFQFHAYLRVTFPSGELQAWLRRIRGSD